MDTLHQSCGFSLSLGRVGVWLSEVVDALLVLDPHTVATQCTLTAHTMRAAASGSSARVDIGGRPVMSFAAVPMSGYSPCQCRLHCTSKVDARGRRVGTVIERAS